MALNQAHIQALIAEGKIVDITDIDVTNSYTNVSLWQPGNKKNGSGANAYPEYALPLQSLINAAPGTPIAVKNEGNLISDNILSLDFRGAVVDAVLDTADLTGRSIIVQVNAGGGGGGGTVVAVGANNGLRLDPLSTPTSPMIQLGENPLLDNTIIPTGLAGYNLSLTGAGKFGVGLSIPGSPIPSAKLQVRGNGGATGITGIANGFTLNVTTLTGVPPIVGTINIGDAIFISNNTGIVYGTYITAQTGANTYTLSQAVTGTITATGSPALPNTGNGLTFQTSPLVFKLEQAGGSGVPALEVWENGAIKSGRLVLSKDGAVMSFGYQTNSNPFLLGDTGSSFSAARLGAGIDLSLGGEPSTTFAGNIRFNRSGFSTIGSTNSSTPLYDLNYVSYDGKRRHRFMGAVAISRHSENFTFPSVFGGADSSNAVNNGARQGYSLCVYQPYNGTTSQTFTGYVAGTKLYIYGCGITILPGMLTVGQSISGMVSPNAPLTGILEGTTISNVVTPFVPGPIPAPGDPCVEVAVGEYDLLVNGAPVAQNVGTFASRISITISNYPLWNDTRAMYVDGTIKFVNLPQGAGSAPVGLTAGDIWVDTSANNVLKMV